MTGNGPDQDKDEELSATARSLHREWDSPQLWPNIAAAMRADDKTTVASRPARGWGAMKPWQAVAAAAVLVMAVSSASWLGWRSLRPATPAPGAAAAQERLLNEEALAAIERSEAQYVHAIDELTRLAAPKLEMPDSPLLVNLQERLVVIDMAITEYRAEIARNRFNAHLRRQLLWIYQEKRRTLEQIQEYDPHAL
ncbi:MAG TPA: hypothetical protein VI485_28450 [Vicinamibacterales bacterium]|nr:hypothetical protein [Vicinamibacterales bacterium]